MSPKACAAIVALAAALTGCASSMSGIGGIETYACKAPEGALCTSVSGVYANSSHGAPTIRSEPVLEPPPTTTYGSASGVSGMQLPKTSPGSAIRSNPRVLRLWVAPWEDRDGDLHEESIVHLVVHTGRWLIEHVRPIARSKPDGVTPPPASDPAVSAPQSRDTLSPPSLPLPPGIDGASKRTDREER